MKHVHSVRFDLLEDRRLLSKAHAAAHTAAAKTPVAIVGTLNVDQSGSTSTMNSDGTWTTSVPVSGTLGALGAVRGVWNETVDSFGDASGPEVLKLTNPSGILYLTFNGQVGPKARKLSAGVVERQHPQSLYLGTGAYARSTETGTIQVVSNTAGTVVKSLVLASKGG